MVSVDKVTLEMSRYLTKVGTYQYCAYVFYQSKSEHDDAPKDQFALEELSKLQALKKSLSDSSEIVFFSRSWRSHFSDVEEPLYPHHEKTPYAMAAFGFNVSEY